LDFYDLKNTEAFILIEKSLRRERNQKLIVGILALVSGIALASRFPFKPNEWFLGILTLAFLVVAVLLIVKLIRNWDLEKMELIRLLKYEPTEIVWVYSIQTSRLPFGIQLQHDCTMYFKLMNRDFIEIKLPKEKTKMVSERLNAFLPHATFGYSVDNAQWFAANPELLLKD
jgi:hypothetical protein